jgi:DNA-binding beta-propeller fold protein YncE
MFGGSGKQVGQLSKPYGIAANERGEFYVTDHGNERVQKFSIQ